MSAVEGLCINCETSFSWSRSKMGLCWWCDPKGKKVHDEAQKKRTIKPKRKRK